MIKNKKNNKLKKSIVDSIPFSQIKKNYDQLVINRFKDVKHKYQNISGIKSNKIIYKVYIKDYGDFLFGLTVIEPGKINKEFHMTKGHKHNNPDKEVYILFNGKGKLVVQDKKFKSIDMKKNILYEISGNAGHRLVNIGSKPLEVLTIYSRNSGHNYDFEFKKRFKSKN